MKKILTVLCASALLTSMPVASIFADEYQTKTQADTGTSVELYATMASAYTVKLPTKYDVSAASASFDVEVKGDVDSAKQIVIAEQVDATNKLVDQADENNTVDITVTFGDAIDGADVTADYNTTAKTTVTIAHDALTAGSYKYDLPITISLA